MLTLKKAHFKGHICINLADDAVGTMVWAVRRSYVSNAAMFTDEATTKAFTEHKQIRTLQGVRMLADSSITSVRYDPTGLQHCSYAIYKSADRYIGFNAEYLKILGLTYCDLHATKENPLRGYGMNGHVVVMGVEIPKEVLALLAPL